MIYIFLFFFCCLSAYEPVSMVADWFLQENGPRHTFACLCTTSADHWGKGRIIDLVKWDAKGALFFTHVNTEKVKELSQYPYASLNAWLPQTKRQVTLSGKTSLISREECLSYWQCFPKKMQWIFITSDHKSIVSEDMHLPKEFPEEIPMPESFLGYRLLPDEIILFEIQEGFPLKLLFKRNGNEWIVNQMQP